LFFGIPQGENSTEIQASAIDVRSPDFYKKNRTLVQIAKLDFPNRLLTHSNEKTPRSTEQNTPVFLLFFRLPARKRRVKVILHARSPIG
jgi:hypothetical protein